MVGSCCGGCELTKAAFAPANPSPPLSARARPPFGLPRLPPPTHPPIFFHICHAHTPSLHMRTHSSCHSRNFPLSSRNMAGSCAVNSSLLVDLFTNLQYTVYCTWRLQSQAVFFFSLLCFALLFFSKCFCTLCSMQTAGTLRVHVFAFPFFSFFDGMWSRRI